MKKILFIIAVLVSQTALSKNVLWDGNPIDLDATIGQETRVDFPETIVELDISKGLEHGSDILLTPEGKLFWTPKKEFQKERLIGVSITGTLYMLNVSSATEAQEDAHFIIVDPVVGVNHNVAVGNKNQVGGKSQMPSSTGPTTPKVPYGTPDFLKKDNSQPSAKTKANFPQMASFAIAHYTGPKRMIPKLAASKVSTNTIPTRWIRTDANRIYTKMVSAWLIDGYYVTAIYAQNKSNTPISFDPGAFRGRYVFSATLNAVLEPKGHLGDETIWVFISDVPFHKALSK